MIARRVALGFVAVLAVLYGVSPWLMARALPPVLARWGIESSEFSFGYPRWHGIDIAEFELKTGDMTILGSRAHVAYGLAIFRGEVESVVIDALTVRVARKTETPLAATTSIEMPAFWALLPTRHLRISQLAISNASPAVAARGSVSLDPTELRLEMRIDSPLLALPLTVRGTANPDGRLAIGLLEQGSTKPIGMLTGVPAARNVMTFDGRIALFGRPLSLAAAYVGLPQVSGSVHAEIHARAPWPLSAADAWKQISGTGGYRLQLDGSAPVVAGLKASAAGAFTIADGNVEARINAGSAVQADVPELVRAGERVKLGPRVSVKSDRDVEIDYAQGTLRIGDGLIATLTTAGKTIAVRPSGVYRADRSFELALAGLDRAPIVSATGVPEGAQSVSMKARLVLSGKVLQIVTESLGLAQPRGHVDAGFEGTVGWPLVNDAAQQSTSGPNMSGKGRIDLNLAGRLSKQPFEVSLKGTYVLGELVKMSFDSGVHIALTGEGIDVSTARRLTVIWDPMQARLSIDPVDLKVALAPISVGTHRISLSRLSVAVDRAALDGDTLTGSAEVRSHPGLDALPLRVTVSHDLSKATGTFSLSGNWRTAKPLLATQLPGFGAPYDLDEGSVAFALDGRWNASKALEYSARGHVRIDGRRAHYEDYAISGLSMDLPLKIDTRSYAVADSKISIDAIDIGFPLTNVSLGLAASDGIASIRDLSGSVLGGRFSASKFSYEIASDKSAPTIILSGVSLPDVLALEGDDVKGSGVLDGTLPVAIDGEAFTVRGGRVAARPPGGTLMYKGAAASTMVAQSGFGFAFRALEDFRYDTLDANVALAADGALTLGVRLQGRNPTVEQGRVIQFNLNLNESLPALLESLRAAENVTDRVEKRFAR